AGQQARDHRDDEREQQHAGVQLGELGITGRLLAYAPQAKQREPEAEQAASEANRPGLDQALGEDRATRCPQRATYADLGGAAQELGQQQADGIDQADQQEAHRQPYLQAYVTWHRAVLVEPAHHVAQAHAGRALEPARGALLVGIVHQVAPVRVDLRRRVQLDPILDPGARRIDRVVVAVVGGITGRFPAVHVSAGTQLQRARGRERQEYLFDFAIAGVA